MTIDINSVGSGQNQNIGVDKANRQNGHESTTARAPASQGSTSDKVTFTGDAAQLRGLEDAVRQTSGVDTKKVEAIKTAITEGKFEINAEKIATKLIELESDLRN